MQYNARYVGRFLSQLTRRIARAQAGVAAAGVAATRYRLFLKSGVSCEESGQTPHYRTCNGAEIATLLKRNARKQDPVILWGEGVYIHKKMHIIIGKAVTEIRKHWFNSQQVLLVLQDL